MLWWHWADQEPGFESVDQKNKFEEGEICQAKNFVLTLQHFLIAIIRLLI
jgi:hypothetical protein